MLVSEQTQKQIESVLERIALAYGAGDIENLMAVVDPDFRGYGTGIDEVCIGKEGYRRQVERDLSEGSEIDISYNDLAISAEGTIAWVMAEMLVNVVVDGRQVRLSGRYTAVFRGTGHAWLLAQAHLSLPAAGQEAGRSFPEE
jgi:ketosteroid isomerase-like protein